MSAISRFSSLPLWLADRFFSNWLRGALIALRAARFSPDLIHVLEFQNAGYSLLRARKLSKTVRGSKLLLTPYGSDIFWFQNFPNHLRKIRKLLQIADAISCECRRDELLASKYGFTGRFTPRIPAFGGVNLLEPSADRGDRNVIAIKGYQYSLGQALNAIRAVELVSHALKNFDIVLFSCNRVTVRAAKNLAQTTGLSVVTHRKFALTNQQVLDLFTRSVLYIGLSKSDGISASMIEAMANGAVPIQSNSSCGGEWLEESVGGYLVSYDDVPGIADLIVKIIGNPGFQSQAALKNFNSLSKKLDPKKVKAAALETYQILS